MALYKNHSQESPIASVEFASAPQGNLTFIHLRENADVQNAKQTIAQALGQQIDTETTVGKHTVLGTHGDKTQEETLAQLKDGGNNLAIPPEEKQKMNMWKLRGLGSMIGQPLQLASSYLQPKGLDTATMGFAISNMSANIINYVFGAQKEKDKHRLLHIKQEINDRIAPYLPEGTQPIDTDDNRSKLHNDKKQTFGEKAYDFGKRYSVTGGDIGLRYIGALSLALPLTKLNPVTKKYTGEHWKKGIGELGKGEIGKALNTLKNDDKATLLAGAMYIGGKALSLTSKVPDPYNKEKKHTWVDTMREKVVFPVSSVIEASAAGIIALDRLNIYNFKDAKGIVKKREISFDKIIDKVPLTKQPQWMKEMKGNKYRDWIGGIGGLLFTGALALRVFAPFGVREVDMKEVDAHTADSLALVPADKLPQALAETTAYLTDHFRDKKDKRTLQFSDVYAELAGDLKKFHNIDVPGMGAEPATMLAKAAAPEAAAPEPAAKTFAKADLKKPDIAAMARPASYQDRAASTETTQMSIGA